MSILFGTGRSRYPDFGDPNGGIAQLEDETKKVLNRVLTDVGARIFNNSFVEDGVQNVPGSSYVESKFNDLKEPSKRKLYSQKAELTILLKKRHFSSLRENYDLRFADDDERVFLKAVKHLFRRKCEQIAFHENLTNLDKVVQDPSFLTLDGFLDDILSSILTVLDLGFGAGGTVFGIDFNPFEDLSQGLSAILGDASLSPIINTIFKLRDVNQRSKQSKFTRWISDPTRSNVADVGQGTGVIEFTMATSVNTTVSLNSGAGNANIVIQDPYRLTRITETDVELALKSAINQDDGFPAYFDARGQLLMEEAMELDVELNQLRLASGKSEINFEFPFGSDNEVVGTIININQPFNLSNTNNIPLAEQLSLQELIRVQKIFRNLQEYKVIQDRAVINNWDTNGVSNTVRNKLRREFVGRYLFQQMDSVHVFMNTFTREETPIYETRGDLLLGDLFTNRSTLKEQRGRIDDDTLEAERQVIAPELPLLVYKTIRNPMEFRGSGPQIFCGLVTVIRDLYNAKTGEFTLSVECKDNMEYLRLSRINTSPSPKQPQGELEDPLTPFDIEVQESTGLVTGVKLSETNRKRLPFIKLDDRPFLGEPVENEDRLIVDTSDEDNTGILTYRHAPGLVYKWKEGIIAATAAINMSTPLDGRKNQLSNLNDDFGVTLNSTPFANLDIADILSLLITGQPHNYNTFLQNALHAGNFTIDNDLNKRHYLNYLFDFLERQDSINGNFIPAKQTGINPHDTARSIRLQRQFTNQNSKLNDLQRQRARLEDRLGTIKDDDTDKALEIAKKGLESEIQALNDRISELNNQIESQELEISNESGQIGQIQLFGNSVRTELADVDYRAIKDRLKYILMRKPEEVRFNQDKNFFVVSDKYDADVDIKAFTLELKGNSFDLFKSQFNSPYDICENARKVIDFEFFADSQGNLVFRPPEYNKVPMSLLIKMAELAGQNGVKIAPDFVINLLGNRVQLLQEKAYLLELQIYEKALLLGNDGLDTLFVVEGSSVPQGINIALKEAPDGSYVFSLDKAKKELSRNVVFTEAAQAQATFGSGSSSSTTNLDVIAKKIIRVRNQILYIDGGTAIKVDDSGGDPDVLSLDPDRKLSSGSIRQLNENLRSDVELVIEEINKYQSSNTNSSTNRLNLVNSLAQIVSERQINLLMWSRLAEQKQDISKADSALSQFSPLRRLASEIDKLNPFTSDEPMLPPFLEDLIEDDLRNETGFNSGQRYIIRDDVILSSKFEVKTPETNRVDVQGDENLAGKGVRGAFPIQYWAGATDFDSWRQYGYRRDRERSAPWLTSPETQGAPYATFILNQQRRKIHSGTVVIIGNEHYQVGDVVYINNRQMLYYVETVSHSASIESGQVQTTLTLTYGHTLGDYIPTPLDILGKGILANGKRSFGGFKVRRALVPTESVVHLETLRLPYDARINEFSIDGTQENAFRSFMQENMGKINNALLKAAGKINKQNQDIASIEVRGYSLSTDPTLTTRVKRYMEQAAVLLKGKGNRPKSIQSLSDSVEVVFDSVSGILNEPDTPLGIEDEYIKALDEPILIDKQLSDEDAEFRRMPSTEAWAYGGDVSLRGRTGWPVNALDIYLVFDKSRRGDKSPTSSAGTHTLPSFNCLTPEFSDLNAGVQSASE